MSQIGYPPSIYTNDLYEEIDLEQVANAGLGDDYQLEPVSIALAIDFNYSENVITTTPDGVHNGRTLYTLLDFGSHYGGLSLHFDGVDTIRLDAVMNDQVITHNNELQDSIVLSGQDFSNQATNTAYIGIQINNDQTPTFYLRYGDTVGSTERLNGRDLYDNLGRSEQSQSHSGIGFLQYNALGLDSNTDTVIWDNGVKTVYYDRKDFADLENASLFLSAYDELQVG